MVGQEKAEAEVRARRKGQEDRGGGEGGCSDDLEETGGMARLLFAESHNGLGRNFAIGEVVADTKMQEEARGGGGRERQEVKG